MGVGHRASGTRQFNGEGFPPAHEDPSIVVAYEPLRVILNRLAHSIFVLKGRCGQMLGHRYRCRQRTPAPS